MDRDNVAGTVCMQFRPEEIDGLPDQLDYTVYRGDEEPADLDRVTFFVPPYMERGNGVALLPRLPRLRVVQTLSAGYDHVRDGLPDGVTLCNAAGVHEASTAELALALTLASLRGIPRFVEGRGERRWQSGFYPALADRRVLVLGYGSIGAAVEERLLPFECSVVPVATWARPGRYGAVHAVDELKTLLPQADVVIVTVRLDEGTTGLIDAEFLGRMRDGALLVNVARGAVVDTDALLAELGTGRLHAALDVTDPEPPPADHPLWTVPNLLLSPHVGGSTSAFMPRASRLLRDQLRRFVDGRQLRNVIVAG